jgi:hypothetical protein
VALNTINQFRALSMKLETIIMHILNKFQENIMVGLWCLMPLSVYIVLLVEETLSAQRKPLTCHKSLYVDGNPGPGLGQVHICGEACNR